jgi:maltooligosyltrehalose trehalohydrolase
MRNRLPRPADRATFEASKLDPAEREKSLHAEALALHRDLLRLRRDEPTIREGRRPGALDGAVLGPEALVARWFDPGDLHDDRLLVVNLGAELGLEVAPEPLLAPPERRRWRVLWSSEDPRYGGRGTAEAETEEQNWRLPAHSALVLAPRPVEVDEVRNLPGTV